MPVDSIITNLPGKLLYEVARGAANGLAKGCVETLANPLSQPKEKSSNSTAIAKQTKEEAQWVQAQSEYLKQRKETDKRARELKHEELQLQQQDLQERRQLAGLQRELMQQLHARAVEAKLTEIQNSWDLESYFSKFSRQETEDILRKGQQQYRLLVLASPPDISEDCPQSFRNNLKIEIQSKLKEFLHQNYPLNPEMGNFSPCPVEFYGDYFPEPISDIRVKQLHKLLAPVPTVVLYCQISDYEVNFHLGYWGLHEDEVSLEPMPGWNWEQADEELKQRGFDEKNSLRIIRQIIVMTHKLLAAFVADLYYLNIDATASYEPRLFELEGEFAWEWFPHELVSDYIETLHQVQQGQRDAYQRELEKMAEVVSWRCTRSFTGFYDNLYRLLGLSADGSKLVGERGDGKITKVWNLRTGKPIRVVDSLHLKNLKQDGKILYHSNLEMWRDFSVRHITLHASSVRSVAFSGDGQLLASGNDDKTIKLWHPHTGELLRTLQGHFNYVSSVAFSADGQLLASGSRDNTIKLWSPYTGELLLTLQIQGHSYHTYSVAFSADGQFLAHGSRDNTIKLWHTYTGELLHTLQSGGSDRTYSLAFSNDGQLLASGSYDNTIKLWHPQTGELLRVLKRHFNYVNSLTFSNDGQLLASGSADNTIKLWHPHTGELLHTLQEELNDLVSVAFNADGQLLASRDKHGIKLWHTRTGELLRALVEPLYFDELGYNKSNYVAFSPDGQFLASDSHDRTLKLWHPHTGKRAPSSSEFPVASPNREFIVKPNYDGTTETWNLEISDCATEELLQTLLGHSGCIEQVIFSEDGNVMVSLGGDLVIKVWRRGEE